MITLKSLSSAALHSPVTVVLLGEGRGRADALPKALLSGLDALALKPGKAEALRTVAAEAQQCGCGSCGFDTLGDDLETE